jgi:hypothetical protein
VWVSSGGGTGRIPFRKSVPHIESAPCPYPSVDGRRTVPSIDGESFSFSCRACRAEMGSPLDETLPSPLTLHFNPPMGHSSPSILFTKKQRVPPNPSLKSAGLINPQRTINIVKGPNCCAGFEASAGMAIWNRLLRGSNCPKRANGVPNRPTAAHPKIMNLPGKGLRNEIRSISQKTARFLAFGGPFHSLARQLLNRQWTFDVARSNEELKKS